MYLFSIYEFLHKFCRRFFMNFVQRLNSKLLSRCLLRSFSRDSVGFLQKSLRGFFRKFYIFFRNLSSYSFGSFFRGFLQIFFVQTSIDLHEFFQSMLQGFWNNDFQGQKFPKCCLRKFYKEHPKFSKSSLKKYGWKIKDYLELLLNFLQEFFRNSSTEICRNIPLENLSRILNFSQIFFFSKIHSEFSIHSIIQKFLRE